MKRMFLALIMISSFFAINAQKTIVNDANAEKRTIAGFSGIKVSGGIDIYLTQGDEDGIAVSAAEVRYRDRIKTEVKEGILKIWYDSDGINWRGGNKKLRTYISFRKISHLQASGSSDVYITGTLQATDLTMVLEGSSDLKGNVDIETLKANMSGASDITISGKVGSLTIDASGSSDFKNYDLVAQNCDAHISGSSDVMITVEKELNATASGSSDIHFRGNGVMKKINTSGSSSVKKL